MNLAGLSGRGVSVWLSIAFYRACRQLSEISRWLGEEENARSCEEKAEEIRLLVEKYGWDEKGYLIYTYNDEGRKIGAHECREGQIFLNP